MYCRERNAKMVTEKKTYMSEDVNICILSELKIYKSIANNNLDSFKSYWLHKKALANMQDGKLTTTINL
jgi:hypothetical protein